MIYLKTNRILYRNQKRTNYSDLAIRRKDRNKTKGIH